MFDSDSRVTDLQLEVEDICPKINHKRPTSTEVAYGLELVEGYWERLSLPMSDLQELIRIAEKALRHLAH